MFNHIYIEERAYAYPKTREILSKLEGRSIINIKHFKDVFNRTGQDFCAQKQEPSLIIAVKEGELLYKGAPVCQSFGNEHFYYTSVMMNCIYDCEYCYLQGMYPSAHVVVFVNTEDYLSEIRALLKKHPVYLCISYDTDLLALDGVFDIVKDFAELAEQEKNLTIELRTKCAARSFAEKLKPGDRFILAWTMSPQEVAGKLEHRAPGLSARIAAAKAALECGFPVRLCFDPMIYVDGWRDAYASMLAEIETEISFSDVRDVSIGTFRISSEYMGRMRKSRRNSEVVSYPYITKDGVCRPDEQIENAMMEFIKAELCKRIEPSKIFTWE